MIPRDDKISSFQLSTFFFLTIVGVGIITFPSILAKHAQNDAWILCISSGLVNIIPIYFMCKVLKKYGKYGFIGMLKILFGKIFGWVLGIPCLIFFAFMTSLELRLIGEAVKTYLLNKTPVEFIIIPILILSFILARLGIEPIVRFYEIIFFVVIFFNIILIFISLPQSDFTNLRPFFSTPLSNYIKGIKYTIFTYAGFEVLLIISPYLRKPEKTFKTATITLFIIILLYTITVIQSLARLGVEETKSLIYPVMDVVKSSDVPGTFIERSEGFLMIEWILTAYTTLVSYIYFFAVTGADLCNFRENKHIISLMLPIIYLMSLGGDSIADVFKIIDTTSLYFGTYTLGVLPFMMYVMMIIKNRKRT